MKYTKEQLDFIKSQREEGTWHEVAEAYNKKYRTDKSADAVRLVAARYGLQDVMGDDEVDYRIVRQNYLASKNSTLSRKKLNMILEAWDQQDSLVAAFRAIVDEYEMPEVKQTVKKTKHADKLHIELVLSDLHYGKKTDSFNNEVARARMQELAHVFISEYVRCQETHEVVGITIACLGDIIENSLMHGAESLKSCEAGNSQQVVWAIESLFKDLLIPMSQIPAPIKFIGISGNHDRPEPVKTYVKPGVEYLTFVIYKTLEMLCKAVNMTNIEFILPPVSYYVHTIFDDSILYDHGDKLKSNKEEVVRGWVAKRQEQLGKPVKFYRFGHWHGPVMYGRGKYIGNGSLCGSDDYSEELGYSTEALQTINFYCSTKERPTSFYKTFQVYLDEVKK